MSLSKNKIKYLNSFLLKKNRDKEQVFVAEGIKLVGDLLPYFQAKVIVGTSDWFANNKPNAEELIEIEDLSEMKKITQLSSPTPVFALFYKQVSVIKYESLLDKKALILVLDSIQDPGNMGTIIRIADWFGIRNIVCSHSTVDIYNSKTVQATMGALARVNVSYTDLEEFLMLCKMKEFPIYGTFLDGDSIYDSELSDYGVVIMGNEGKGVSDSVANFVTNKLLIPNYPVNEITSESLNVAVATAIVCSEFRRRIR